MYEDVLDLWYMHKIDAWEAVVLLTNRYDIGVEKALEIMNTEMDNHHEYLEKQKNLYDQLGGNQK